MAYGGKWWHACSVGIAFVTLFDPSLCHFGTVQKHLVDVLPKVRCFKDLGTGLHYFLMFKMTIDQTCRRNHTGANKKYVDK